jgi:UDP-GlcNAc:undecaprenyl-phosphate/decaprenyl-phosphate GlcNAc-1-phosphate transferase
VPAGSGYLIVGGVAAGATFVLTPMVRWWAIRIGRVTPPDHRSVHLDPTPSIGGVAMFGGMLAALAAATQMDRFDSYLRGYEVLGIAVAGSIVFGVGFVDEWRKGTPRAGRSVGISAPAKLSGVVLAGIVLVLAGVTMWYFRVPFSRVLVVPADLRPLVTVVWLALIANAVNLIDGLDGLAAGIVAIAAGTFFLYSWELEKSNFLIGTNVGPLVAIITCGMCVGFLPWNVHPAKIFMGDCGALLIGLLMAVCTSVVGGRVDQSGLVPGSKAASGQTYFFFAPLVIPLVVLGVPIFDTLFAVVRRASRGAVATADKEHLHHRLMRLGHGHRRSVAILWIWTALLSSAVLYPTYTGRGNALVPQALAALALILYTVLHPEVRRRSTRSRRRHPVSGDVDRANLDGATSN